MVRGIAKTACWPTRCYVPIERDWKCSVAICFKGGRAGRIRFKFQWLLRVRWKMQRFLDFHNLMKEFEKTSRSWQRPPAWSLYCTWILSSQRRRTLWGRRATRTGPIHSAPPFGSRPRLKSVRTRTLIRSNILRNSVVEQSFASRLSSISSVKHKSMMGARRSKRRCKVSTAIW